MPPENVTFWIVVAVGIAIVVVVALLLGRGLEIGKWFVRVKPTEPRDSGSVSVGRNFKMSGGKIGGDVAGIKQSGDATSDVSKEDVDVLRGGRFRDVDVSGDVTGVKQEDRTDRKR